jgi:hypothetical protein
MRAVHTRMPEHLQTRECLRCGYRGPELQSERPEPPLICPACGEDLYSRPPRSYAELEGLEDTATWAGWSESSRSGGRVAAICRRIIRLLVLTIARR